MYSTHIGVRIMYILTESDSYIDIIRLIIGSESTKSTHSHKIQKIVLNSILLFVKIEQFASNHVETDPYF